MAWSGMHLVSESRETSGETFLAQGRNANGNRGN